MNTASPERLSYLPQLCKNNEKTAQLRSTLLTQQDLLRMPNSFWTVPGHHIARGGWWVRALKEGLTKKCLKCNRIWAAHHLELNGCIHCATSPFKKCKTIRAKQQTKSPNLKQTLGLVMRTVLPEEIEKMSKHDLISDTNLTLPHIQCCLEEILQDLGTTKATPHGAPSIYLWLTSPELGYPLQDDNYDRPLNPMIGPFLRAYLSEPRDIEDDDDEMGFMTRANTIRGPWLGTCWTHWTCLSPYLTPIP